MIFYLTVFFIQYVIMEFNSNSKSIFAEKFFQILMNVIMEPTTAIQLQLHVIIQMEVSLVTANLVIIEQMAITPPAQVWGTSGTRNRLLYLLVQ